MGQIEKHSECRINCPEKQEVQLFEEFPKHVKHEFEQGKHELFDIFAKNPSGHDKLHTPSYKYLSCGQLVQSLEVAPEHV